MKARILVAVVCLPGLLAVLYLCPPVFFTVLIALLSAIGIFEALWNTGFARRPVITGGAVLYSALVPFWVFYQGTILQLGVALYLLFLLLFGEALIHHRVTTPEQLGGAFLFSALIPFGLSALIYLNGLPYGRFLVLLPILAAFISDAGGLFTGMVAGKHKLAPEPSPKKTVEGAVGALVAGTLSMALYGLVLQEGFSLSVSFPALIVYGLLGSLISMMGDLSFSYVKRHFGIKDYGRLFPGHGGVLDRFDSVIFCSPLMVLLVHLFPAITM
jgi:phosphatidate cytidylyltransferase